MDERRQQWSAHADGSRPLNEGAAIDRARGMRIGELPQGAGYICGVRHPEQSSVISKMAGNNPRALFAWIG
jgi:hypothetical protein